MKEDAEDGDEIYYKFVMRSNLLSGFEGENPYMKNRFYILLCAAAGEGARWHHFGRTVDEAIEKCLQQTVACVLAAINVANEELEQQLKAGRLEKLPELPKPFFTKKRVEEARRARARRPIDVPRHRTMRDEQNRLNRASRAASGVLYVKGPDGPELVVKKGGKRASKYAQKEKAKATVLAKQIAARKMAMAKMSQKMTKYKKGSRKYKAAMLQVTCCQCTCLTT